LKQDANFSRHWKYLNHATKIGTLPKGLEKDFYTWNVDFEKKGTNFCDEMRGFVK
jgi:hypothetical protein